MKRNILILYVIIAIASLLSCLRNGDPIGFKEVAISPDVIEYFAYVTRDGEYLFFMSRRPGEIEADKLTYEELTKLYNRPETGNSSIYWMDAGFIESLRQTAVFN